MSAVMDLVSTYRRMLRKSLQDGADPEEIVETIRRADSAFTGTVKALVESRRTLSDGKYTKCLEDIVGIGESANGFLPGHITIKRLAELLRVNPHQLTAWLIEIGCCYRDEQRLLKSKRWPIEYVSIKINKGTLNERIVAISQIPEDMKWNVIWMYLMKHPNDSLHGLRDQALFYMSGRG